VNRLWNRKLDHYPDTAPRIGYLAIVVLSTIVLYYELYVQGAVTPSIISQYHMGFPFFVYLVVVGNACGAFASLVAGLADRWGRANLVTWGLLVTALLILFGIPNAPNEWAYAILFSAIGFVEGIVLVATPALVRDFSPQLGRASAMGFWTMGPVIGSLVVTVISSHTLGHLHAWQDQFTICGFVGLGVFVIAFVGLRELSPPIRDQLMVSLEDRALIEAKAAGIDIKESLRHPWRQMFHADIIGSALAISLFLFIYYTMVAFLVVYFAAVFNFSQQRANALGNWMWGFDAIALVITGLVSDRLRVRKPFMIIGAVGTIVMSTLFALRTSHPHTGYYTFAFILALLAVFLGIAFAPWMASFTETVERRNPALTATGLAVWGWILRVVVALLLLVLPHVITSATPLVNFGTRALAIQTAYPKQVATLSAIDPKASAILLKNPTNGPAIQTALKEVVKEFHITPTQAILRLVAASKVPHSDLVYLAAHGRQVQAAQKAAPSEWRRWWWVCIGGQILFIPLIFLMAGRWSPRAAKRDKDEHDRRMEAELAAFRQSHPAAVV
jgi:MFS family permease